MTKKSPLEKSRAEYEDTIGKITLKDSPVGIDAQYTHAVIIEFLKGITERLDAIEKKMDQRA